MIKKILLGLVIYLVFMVALFPARVAVSLAPLPRELVISGVSGSIWQGQAETLILDGRHFGQVHWQLGFWKLFTGKLDLDVNLGNRGSAVNGKGEFVWSLSGIDIDNLRFEAPGNFIIGNTRLPFRTKIDGDLSLIVPVFHQGKPWCEALDGKVFVNHLSVTNQFGHYPVGNIQLGLSCDAGQLVVNTDEKNNRLGLTAKVTLGENNKLLVEGKIRETQDQPADLRQALSFLGRSDNQGYYPIRYSGVIPSI